MTETINPAQIVEAIRRLRVHDVSPLIAPELPMWFLYAAPKIESTHKLEEVGFRANVVSVSEHTGTHVDAPAHFVPHGKTVEELPADALFMRPFKKLDLTWAGLGPSELVEAEHLETALSDAALSLEEGDVAVLELGWDRHLPGGDEAKEPGWWGSNQPGLSEGACRFLGAAGICAVASDTAAADVAVKDGEIASGHGHSDYFLPRGILIVEGLHGLANVPTTGLFAALPLKIKGGTGSPLRILMLTE